MSVRIERDDLGPIARVRESLTLDDRSVIGRSGVHRLDLSVRGSDLNVLHDTRGLEQIEALSVVDHVLSSDGAITSLPTLREISLETYAKDPIDFASFARLERVHLNWRPAAETLFEQVGLESLSLAGYPFADLTPLARLSRLEGLRIASAPRLVSVKGIAELPALKVQRLLDDKQLRDLAPFADATPSLVDIELNVCRKVADISALANQTGVRRISLIDDGRIDSIKPLADLPALEEFWFYGTTIIEDGDLTPLLRMPALKRTSFANRRHYSHGIRDIERLRHLNDSAPLPHWRW